MYNKILLSFLLFVLFSCGGVESPNSSNNEQNSISKTNDAECLQWLSAADINRQNGSYQDCVDAYNISLDEGCGGKYPEQIYQWMGRAYIQLNKIDSAKWAVDKGLRALPEDLQLLNVAAFVSRKQNLADDELYFLDKKLQLEEEIQSIVKTIDSNSLVEDILDLQKSLGKPKEYCDGIWSQDLEDYISIFNKSRENTYKSLSDFYKNQELYDDQIDILDDWLAYSPDNPAIFKEKKSAYMNLGKNPIDIDKERWRNDPSNIKFGLDYIKKLKEELLSEKIVDVALSLLDYDSNNLEVLENLGEAYLDLYMQDDALQIYGQLIALNNQSPKYLIEISKIYLDIGEYDNSLEYADKAVNLDSAEAFNNRAQIYKGIVESCVGDELTMSDKAVYEMAWEDLNLAIDKGYRRARKDADFLRKNYITQRRDWFLNVDDSKRKFKPTDPCYNIIERSITKRNF